jgi:hypothetical protein
MGYKIPNIKKVNPIELPCRKKMYHTLAEAEDMIRYIKENRVSKEIHAYQCESCGFWHLTSKPASRY